LLGLPCIAYIGGADMGLLQHIHTKRMHRLPLTLVGRGDTCDLQVDNQYVSKHHAEVMWVGVWEVHDLGSRNGTFVGEHRLEAGSRMSLSRGTKVSFGDPDDVYVLIDDAPPRPWAKADDGQESEAEGKILSLPSPDDAILQIFQDQRGRWQVESPDGKRDVAHGDTVNVAGHDWILHLPITPDVTQQPDKEQLYLRTLTLRFRDGDKGEAIGIEMSRGDEQVTVLEHHNHHTLLFELAKKRMDDVKIPDLPEAEQGWLYVGEVILALDLDNESQAPRNLLHQHVFRARRQFERAGVIDGAHVIQRRSSAKDGQLRLGTDKIQIIRDDE
jgi:hypothetical protein